MSPTGSNGPERVVSIQKGSLNILLGMRGTRFDKTSPRSIRFEYLNDRVDEITIMPQYTSRFTFNYEVEFSYYYQIQDYIKLFASVGFVTGIYYSNLSVGAAVGF